MTPLEAVERLRRSLDPALARAAAELYDLRRRAGTKLVRAERLLLTRRGLEQASHRHVAAARAERIAAHVREELPGAWVLDATAGLGGDALALAEAGIGRLVAADRDATVVRLLRANLVAQGHAARAVRAAAEHPAVRADILVLDPDRREPETGAAGRRLGDPERWSPAWSHCAALLVRHRGGCAKLAPAVDVARLEATLPTDTRRTWQWVSLAGELKEVVLWTGALARSAPGEREVLRVTRSGERLGWSACPRQARALDPGAARAIAWLAEPDPTVIRAGLIGALATLEGLFPLAPEIAYLGGARPSRSAFLRVFRVLGHAPLDRRRVRALLAHHDVGPLTVKKRGHPDDAETLARRLRGRGARPGVLVVARLADGHHAFLVAEQRSGRGAPAVSSAR